jgi:hypothetical protein
MRSLRKGFFWSSGRRWLWAGSFGFAMAGTAFGQDCAPGACGPDCCDLHEQNAAKMHAEYNKLLGITGTCCPDSCAAPADVCTDVCAGEECAGEGCAGEKGCCNGGLCGELGDPWTLQSKVCGEDPCNPPFLTFGGWTALGYTSASTGLFNAHPNRVNLTQQYFFMEHVADGSNGLDFGGRADAIYGVDAQDTQAFGEPAPQTHWDTSWDHGIYGWAIPQLYAEAAMGDFSVKAGHFYTLVGYEVVTAPDNFFYSHSFTMYNSEPFTHTGVLGTYNASDKTTLYGGWVAGWDTGFANFTDATPGDTSRGSAAIFGVSQGLGEVLTVTYIGLAGDMGLNGEGYNHSVVCDFALSDKWNYVLQSDLVRLNFDSIGINNFLFYTINNRLAVGGRAEWYKSNLAGNGWESVYVTTAGVNYKPFANLIIRPEWRYQWGAEDIINGLSGTNGRPGVANQGIFGIDAILTF